jgi:hypothetical protein
LRRNSQDFACTLYQTGLQAATILLSESHFPCDLLGFWFCSSTQEVEPRGSAGSKTRGKLFEPSNPAIWRLSSSRSEDGSWIDNPMVIEKNRNTNFRLSSKERKQLLLWGSILVLAMLCLIYLITPSDNSPQKPVPTQQETGNTNRNKPASPGL